MDAVLGALIGVGTASVEVEAHMNAPQHAESMTTISQAAYDAATQDGISPHDAAEVLLQKIEIRRFRDVLLTFVDEDRARAVLTDGLCANDPTRNRASVDKKIRGWLVGKYQPTARADLLELCFVLRLNPEQADVFLTRTGDEGLHWRDPLELVYAFALERGMTYAEANALYERVKPDQTAAATETESFTPLVRQGAQSCKTEEELREYLNRVSGKMGQMHNSAYRQFMAMMQMLEQPDSFVENEERRYTVREVVEKYLDKKLPSVREGKNLEEKKRCILADWPDEITLSRMKNRKSDVTRKTLMLLFLATDEGDDADDLPDYAEDEEWDETPTEPESDASAAFRSSHLRMDQMLASCGYGTLDPRNAFDWIVLYCMGVRNDPVSMDGLNERLTHVLDVLFTATSPES